MYTCDFSRGIGNSLDLVHHGGACLCDFPRGVGNSLDLVHHAPVGQWVRCAWFCLLVYLDKSYMHHTCIIHHIIRFSWLKHCFAISLRLRHAEVETSVSSQELTVAQAITDTGATGEFK